MRIDLTKLLNTNLYKIAVDTELTILPEYLVGTDIKSITPVKVSGYVYNNDEELSLEIVASGTMILTCARTLKDVEYPFNIEINEIIGENEDNSLEIVQNSLDIFPIVWQNILVDVPLRVLHPDAKEESLEGDGWRLITEEDKKEVIDPRLAKLKDFIKE